MSADELIDVLDEYGNKTGRSLSKRKVHQQGLWHAGADVWIYNRRGEVLLQLRAPTKEIYPDTWDISAAGHLLAGESPVEAALREIQEEIGLKLQPSDLEFVGTTRTDHLIPGAGYMHRVFDATYVVMSELDTSSMKLLVDEVADVRWWPLDGLEAALDDPRRAVQFSRRPRYFYELAFTEIRAALARRAAASAKPIGDTSDIYKAGGIIIKDRKTLVERSHDKEFFISPGGKIEPGETPRQSLVRELKGEFQIDVDEQDLEPCGSYSDEAANHPGRTVHIEYYMVKKWRGEIRPDHEVEEMLWLTSDFPRDLKLASLIAREIIPKLKAKGFID